MVVGLQIQVLVSCVSEGTEQAVAAFHIAMERPLVVQPREQAVAQEEAFGEIEGTRVERCKKHKLTDILMIVFIGYARESFGGDVIAIDGKTGRNSEYAP